jgi:DNA polymerase I-like protein with 3'-5' exonuclease and polymerase domains
LSSTASDLNNYAANRVMARFKDLGLSGKLILLVHDSQLYDIPEKEVEQSIKIIKEEMERNINNMITPMSAEFKIGTHWGALEKIHV